MGYLLVGKWTHWLCHDVLTVWIC